MLTAHRPSCYRDPVSRLTRTGIRLSAVLVLVGCWLVGCSLDWSLPSATSDAGGLDGSDLLDAGGPMGSDAPSKNDASNPPPGMCRTNAECASDELCTFATFNCGASGLGSCTKRKPPSCTTASVKPVGTYCACGGKDVESACAALEDGIDLAICTGIIGNPNTRVSGYAKCPEPAILIDDGKEPHERRFRCAATTCDAGDCPCLNKAFCSNLNGKCDGTLLRCN